MADDIAVVAVSNPAQKVADGRITYVKLESSIYSGRGGMSNHHRQQWSGYIDDHPHLKVGVYIELDGDEGVKRTWKITELGPTHYHAYLKEGWNNNL